MNRRGPSVGPWLALLLVAGCASARTPSPSAPQPTGTPSAVPLTAVPSSSLHVSPAPSPTAVQTAPATPTLSLAPSPTPTAAALEIAWRLARRDSGFGVLFDVGEWPTFRSGVVFRDRFFIAAGQDDGQEEEIPYVWSSGDGLSWEGARLAEEGHVRRLVAGPAGLLAVVSPSGYLNDGALWLSSDGHTWERITDPDVGPGSVISNIAATTGGYIAFGSAAWTSADGREWQAVNSPSISALIADGVQVVAISGESLLAVTGGSRWPNSSPLKVWLSTNLTDWTNVGTLPHSAIMDSPGAAAGPLGWVVWGSGYRRERIDRMWLSPDGQTWEEIAQPPGPVSDVFVDPVGFIAVGFLLAPGCAINPADMQGRTWTSRDGHTWTEMPREGWEFRRVDHLFRNDRKLIGLGVIYSDTDDGSAQGSVWTAQLPQVPQTGPSPTAGPIPTEVPDSGCGD